MKQIFKDKITNIPNTDLFDNKFLFEYLETDFKNFNDSESSSEGQELEKVEVFYMSELLKKKENTELLNNLNGKFAMYSEVYSPKDELEIFQELFDYAISNKKKIHIIGITLKEELEILEKYYIESGYLREDVNCFIVDFAKTLVSVSVNIENLMWRGSDYKANGKKIFFVPPVRESGQNKAMFKGINRGSIAGIVIQKTPLNLSLIRGEIEQILPLNKGELEGVYSSFLQNCIKEEKILPLTLAKVLKYNLEDIGFKGNIKNLEIQY